jgi:hypothetical protein
MSKPPINDRFLTTLTTQLTTFSPAKTTSITHFFQNTRLQKAQQK